LLGLLGCTPSIGADNVPPADFDAWVVALRADALAREISVSTLDQALTGIEPLPRVVELDRDQPEFKLSFAQYMDRVVTAKRVATGRKKLAEHQELLREIQKRYNVPPRVVVALWGIESDYGRRPGSFPTVQALLTLAYDGRRAKFFRGELLDALQIIDEGHIDSKGMLGSWAGAVGQTQFMPSSFRNFAVDHDGDSRRDIWGSIPDVLASVANYLAGSGWRGDLIWGREVRVPTEFDRELAAGRRKRSLSEWQSLGVRRADGRDLPTAKVHASLVWPDGTDGPAFAAYANFDVLLRWNRSDYFATAVGILSDRIAAP
jgi:membrane-bound lytic murein transglycosylase B